MKDKCFVRFFWNQKDHINNDILPIDTEYNSPTALYKYFFSSRWPNNMLSVFQMTSPIPLACSITLNYEFPICAE